MSNRYGRPWNKSKHSVRRDGMTHLICGICGVEGPPHASNVEARKHLSEDGWSRCYTGSEDQLRCPKCRSTRPPGSNQYTAALAAANARADAAEADRDRHHTTLTTLLDAAEALLAQAETVSGECGEVVARLCRPLADAAAALAEDDGRYLQDHERSRCTAGHVRQIIEEAEAANARSDAAEADRDRHHTTLTTLLDAISNQDVDCCAICRDPYCSGAYCLREMVAELPDDHQECGEQIETVQDLVRLGRILTEWAAAAATQQDTPT